MSLKFWDPKGSSQIRIIQPAGGLHFFRHFAPRVSDAKPCSEACCGPNLHYYLIGHDTDEPRTVKMCGIHAAGFNKRLLTPDEVLVHEILVR